MSGREEWFDNGGDDGYDALRDNEIEEYGFVRLSRRRSEGPSNLDRSFDRARLAMDRHSAVGGDDDYGRNG